MWIGHWTEVSHSCNNNSVILSHAASSSRMQRHSLACGVILTHADFSTSDVMHARTLTTTSADNIAISCRSVHVQTSFQISHCRCKKCSSIVCDDTATIVCDDTATIVCDDTVTTVCDDTATIVCDDRQSDNRLSSQRPPSATTHQESTTALCSAQKQQLVSHVHTI